MLALALARQPIRLDGAEAVLTVVLVVLVLAARLFPVHVAPNVKVRVGTAPLFAAVLLLPAPVAMLVGALTAVTAEGIRRQPWLQTLFFTAESVLRVAAGAATFALVADDAVITDLHAGRWLVAVPLVALAMYLVNQALVDLMVGLQLRRVPPEGVWRRWRFNLPHEGALFLLGYFIAAIGVASPWVMALVLLPSFIVHRALRDGVTLKVQTREALVELADIVDMRDHYTFEHSRRVAALAGATAKALGLPSDQGEVIEMAARLHDVGKIGIKSTVLLNPAQLGDREQQEMRSHPEVGARLVAKFPEFSRGRDLVLAHHERYDGSGYPRGLAGDRIPLGARIIAVADAWDAMTSHRAYRDAIELDRAYAELVRGRGTQFDPAVLDAFLRVLKSQPDLARPHLHERQETDVARPGPVPA